MINVDFSPPEGLTIPLWRSLVINLADRFAPERLPPLPLTSKPVDVGLLPGDMLQMPWYRTVIGNLADVVSPETLPPLQLESQPVDVGELLGDELSHSWWNSLLQNLRDRLSPERLPPLQVTSHPVAGFGAESSLQILDWSDLIDAPKQFRPDAIGCAATGASYHEAAEVAVPERPAADPTLVTARLQLMRDIGRTRFRRKIWMSLAAAEAVFLLVEIFRVQ